MAVASDVLKKACLVPAGMKAESPGVSSHQLGDPSEENIRPSFEAIEHLVSGMAHELAFLAHIEIDDTNRQHACRTDEAHAQGAAFSNDLIKQIIGPRLLDDVSPGSAGLVGLDLGGRAVADVVSQGCLMA